MTVFADWLALAPSCEHKIHVFSACFTCKSIANACRQSALLANQWLLHHILRKHSKRSIEQYLYVWQIFTTYLDKHLADMLHLELWTLLSTSKFLLRWKIGPILYISPFWFKNGFLSYCLYKSMAFKVKAAWLVKWQNGICHSWQRCECADSGFTICWTIARFWIFQFSLGLRDVSSKMFTMKIY